MSDHQSDAKSLSIVSKALIASGVILCIAGALVALVSSVPVGAVMIVVGAVDLVMSTVIPKLAARQDSPAGKH